MKFLKCVIFDNFCYALSAENSQLLDKISGNSNDRSAAYHKVKRNRILRVEEKVQRVQQVLKEYYIILFMGDLELPSECIGW